MYGQWIRPDRFINFQELKPLYLSSLKAWAYTLQDVFNGKVERFWDSDIHGYIIEAPTAEEIQNYFTATACHKAQFKYTLAATGTLAANVVAGSVLMRTGNSKYAFIADDGHGSLREIDGPVVGTINYTTGAYALTIPATEIAKFEAPVVGYSVVGTNATFAAYDGDAKTTATVKVIKTAQIPYAQVGFTGYIVTAEESNRFFVGFEVSGTDAQQKIIDEIVKDVTPVAALTVNPTTLTFAHTEGTTGTATISGGVAPYTATSSDSGKLTASVTGTTLTLKTTGTATAGPYTVDIKDTKNKKVTLNVTLS